jgi:hypothetical protein
MAGFSPELVQRALSAMRSIGILPEAATPERAVDAVGDYASQGGPFRPGGPAESVTSNVAQGLVNTPRQFGFTGNPATDIPNMAGYLPSPMGGPSGPGMAGARAGGGGLLTRPVAVAGPSGLLDTSRLDQSRIDEETGERMMTDPALDGHEISLDRMEKSANEYLKRRGDLPASIPDAEVGERVADHFRRTSQGIHAMPEQYREMGLGHLVDMPGNIRDVELGYNQPAAAYLPKGAEASFENGAIRFFDKDPGGAYFRQLADIKARINDPANLVGKGLLK